VGEKEWSVNFTVAESKGINDDEKEFIEKEIAIISIMMDFEEVMLILNVVNTGTSFNFSTLDIENFKSISDQNFDPTRWNHYYIQKIRHIDFDNKGISINVSNF